MSEREPPEEDRGHRQQGVFEVGTGATERMFDPRTGETEAP